MDVLILFVATMLGVFGTLLLVDVFKELIRADGCLPARRLRGGAGMERPVSSRLHLSRPDQGDGGVGSQSCSPTPPKTSVS